MRDRDRIEELKTQVRIYRLRLEEAENTIMVQKVWREVIATEAKKRIEALKAQLDEAVLEKSRKDAAYKVLVQALTVMTSGNVAMQAWANNWLDSAEAAGRAVGQDQ